MPSLPQNPWSLELNDLARMLGTDPEQGLNPSETQKRLLEFGPNSLSEKKSISPWARFLNQFKSPVVLVLVIATILSAFLGEFVDACAIAVILVLNAVVGVIQENKADRAVAALKKMSAPQVRVLRGREIRLVPAEQTIPGDVLILEAGDYVAADARLIEAHALEANEAPLTGESLPVAKNPQLIAANTLAADQKNMVFAGTFLTNGSGRALVTATGMRTQIGQIAALLEKKPEAATPLQLRLLSVSNILLLFCLAVVLCMIGLGWWRSEKGFDLILGAVSLAVAAIPEGLPTMVTLTLALAVRRMAQRHAIVRQLAAVETLGSTHVILSDKTGTLTTGEMRVRQIWPENPEIIFAAALASNASLSPDGQATGDPTEIALVHHAQKSLADFEAQKNCHKRLREWPFESQRKRMSVALSHESGLVLYNKGAPEVLIPLCKLDETQKKTALEKAREFSSRGQRVLAIARAKLKAEDLKKSATEIERDLDFLGLVAIADPPRPEAITAIKSCQDAGIRVAMITGDHPETARAIAGEIGILTPGRQGVMTGTDLEKISDTELVEHVETTAVYARVLPEHKLRIVAAWKKREMIVAMTGDGVNDAPALKEAHIGIAMGKGGTEVARQASALVLADDNFATIVSAVEEGRAVHGNIRRTLRYLMAGNMAEILVMFGASLAGWPVPLFPLQLLWINLVTDGIPILALAAEPVPKNYLAQSQRSSLKSFEGWDFYRHVLISGAIEAILILIVYRWLLLEGDPATARSHAFSLLVFSELFRAFAYRSDTKTFFQLGWSTNLPLFLAVMATITLQLSIHHIPLLATFFRVGPLSTTSCAVEILMALIPVTAIEIHKIMQKHRPVKNA